ncbi:LOW QUALITY PROTEIN: uncharacterized protein LOC112558290 [Pomacea canaliculata]|uniref:LOW QUALITY PROTEIN: uncharacterized protein LOC112558290 n=1 Tax=Pomacea canaliculata TaxID=400727 RepID=UPI000D72CBC9|nr:LOW QUALITY PROTEIN: uncharacterized protein LOC112558290 [Pomacea canaliculata]
MFVLLSLSLLVVDVASVTITVQNHWAGGFQVEVAIPVTCDLQGWTVSLDFDQDIKSIEIWAGDVRQESPRRYLVSSHDYNGEVHTGTSLTLSVIGHTVGDISPSLTAFITDCGDGHGGTLPPGATRTPIPRTSPASTGGGTPTKDYADALGKSILFYDAQRSGKLPANNPITWRGDSALNDCVVGGWYDAGDHIKFGLPFGAATHVLLWGLHLFKDGYERAHQLDMMYDMIKWALDYMLKAWNPVTKELVCQIGEGLADHHFWGRAEDMTMDRPCYKAGAGQGAGDIAAEWAACMAAGSILFKEKGDTSYAAQLLTAAESLYAFAKAHPTPWSGSSAFYAPSTSDDEICEGAIWLYRATRNQKYLNDAREKWTPSYGFALSWDDKKIACQIMVYNETYSGSSQLKDPIEGFFKGWLPGGTVKYTPCGLAWRDMWGANRYAGGAAFAALAAAETGLNTATYRAWAIEQINYMLGDNKVDGGCFSFEIGYGSKYPKSPHHRSASCPDIPQPCSEANLHASGPSPHLLLGALVGGPDVNDSYVDNREDYVKNEVAIDYNAGFQSALAGILHLLATNNFPPTKNACPCVES